MKRILTSLLLFFVVTTNSVAASVGASVSPSIINHNPGVNPSINITWSLASGSTSNSSNFAAYETSAGGFFTDNQVNIIKVITCDTTIAVCFSVNEIISIPTSVLTDAANKGMGVFYIARTFYDGVGSSKARVKIDLTTVTANPTVASPNPSSTLKINREALRFRDNKTYKTVQPNSKIYAQAELRYTGSGLLDAFWEYASSTATNTKGEPIYSRLGLVRRYLGRGGRVILQSPRLPTYLTGQYRVRLQIKTTTTNPNGVEFTSDLPGGLPILRYSVLQSSVDVFSQPNIKTISPHKNALIQKDTLFRWKAVDGATAYQLELYLVGNSLTSAKQPDQGNSPIDASVLSNTKPAAGLLIPAEKTSLTLSSLARDMLRHNQTYYWRIIAIDKKGNVLTSSKVSIIRTP